MYDSTAPDSAAPLAIVPAFRKLFLQAAEEQAAAQWMTDVMLCGKQRTTCLQQCLP
jgi:hypothetical protein